MMERREWKRNRRLEKCSSEEREKHIELKTERKR